MGSYRRDRTPGGMYFFTVTLQDRKSDLLIKHVDKLKAAIHAEKINAPFSIIALVILPDHLHTIWRLPNGDADYSNRWRRIKGSFSRSFEMRKNSFEKSRTKK